MKVKKLFILTFLLSFFAFSNTIYASENYFINNNNVVLTKEEYDFLSKIYWEGFQETMTVNDYNYIFFDDNIVNCEIITETYYPITPFSTVHTTQSKSLRVSKVSSSSNTLVTVNLAWLKSPVIRSYDVIGANLNGLKLVSNPNTYVYYDNNRVNYSYAKVLSNGFGTSIKLPNSGNNISITQTYILNGSGKLYASYQHATENVSLSNSKNYSISISGYGNVFLFNSSVRNKYDAMGGVSITI